MTQTEFNKVLTGTTFAAACELRCATTGKFSTAQVNLLWTKALKGNAYHAALALRAPAGVLTRKQVSAFAAKVLTGTTFAAALALRAPAGVLTAEQRKRLKAKAGGAA